jgi:hypothetical protein
VKGHTAVDRFDISPDFPPGPDCVFMMTVKGKKNGLIELTLTPKAAARSLKSWKLTWTDDWTQTGFSPASKTTDEH